MTRIGNIANAKSGVKTIDQIVQSCNLNAEETAPEKIMQYD